MKKENKGYIIAIVVLSLISIVSTSIAVVEYLKIRDIRVATETVSNVFNIDSSESDDDFEFKDCTKIKLGDTATFATVKMNVTHVERQKSVAKWQEVTAQDGAMFVIVEMEVENITKAPMDVTICDSPIYDSSSGTLYSYDWDASTAHGNISEKIQPGMKATISAVYMVSEKAGDLYYLSSNADTGEVLALALQ